MNIYVKQRISCTKSQGYLGRDNLKHYFYAVVGYLKGFLSTYRVKHKLKIFLSNLIDFLFV